MRGCMLDEDLVHKDTKCADVQYQLEQKLTTTTGKINAREREGE